jgi:peptidyl-prolyl cis-trans isomerase-like 3
MLSFPCFVFDYLICLIYYHSNIKKFIIQGGDPTGTGKGGASIYGKYFDDEIVDTLKHDRRGTLSMANRGPNTNGSQFFFTYDKIPSLNNINTVFGRIIHGMDVLDRMEMQEVDAKDRPLDKIILHEVHIHANPFAE